MFMAGGTGPVDAKTVRTHRGGADGDRIPAGAGEREIFYNLSAGRVLHDVEAGYVYYVDSVHIPVGRIIDSALRGLGSPHRPERRYLDDNACFGAAWRLPLDGDSARVVLSALRLAGVQILLRAAASNASTPG